MMVSPTLGVLSGFFVRLILAPVIASFLAYLAWPVSHWLGLGVGVLVWVLICKMYERGPV